MTEWPDLAGRLRDGAHVLPVRVYYEDTDFSGIVYHGSYVRFFERGRSDFLRLLGIHHNQLHGQADDRSLAFAVRRMNIEFYRPAKIDDLLEVETRFVDAKGARIFLSQRICNGQDVLVEAEVMVALITAEGKPTRLPSDIAARLSSF